MIQAGFDPHGNEDDSRVLCLKFNGGDHPPPLRGSRPKDGVPTQPSAPWTVGTTAAESGIAAAVLAAGPSGPTRQSARRPKSFQTILSNPLVVGSWLRIPNGPAEFFEASGSMRKRLIWRREWDSNPRTPVKMLLEFQSSAFDRSAISPINQLRGLPQRLSAPGRPSQARESYTVRPGEAPASAH
jgi:hypothetical protein